MKTLRKMKKGFTIVELVIVIAVIAVLTAILVPTFISISNKANEASDKSLVKNLNTALRMAEGDQGKKNETMFDAVEDVKEYAGIMLPQFVSKSGDEILWDSVTDEFVWKTAKPQGRADVLLWTIVDSYDSSKQTYSMFAGSKWSSSAVSVEGLTVGFDVGYHSEITTVSYTRPDNATAQTATIRTNNEEAVVTITAKSDIVKHYGLAKKVDVVKVDLDHSFHSNGTIGFAQVAYGHFVADAGKVYGLYASTDDTVIDENGGEIVDAYKADGVNKNGNKDFTEIPSGKTIADIEAEAEGNVAAKAIRQSDIVEGGLRVSSGKYKLAEDITISNRANCIKIGDDGENQNQDVTLDLAGHVLKNIDAASKSRETYAIYLIRSTFTIKDSVGGGAINNDANGVDNAYGILSIFSTVIVDGGVLGGNSPKTLVAFNSDLHLYVRAGQINGLIEACTTSSQYGVYLHSSGTYKITSPGISTGIPALIARVYDGSGNEISRGASSSTQGVEYYEYTVA